MDSGSVLARLLLLTYSNGDTVIAYRTVYEMMVLYEYAVDVRMGHM